MQYLIMQRTPCTRLRGLTGQVASTRQQGRQGVLCWRGSSIQQRAFLSARARACSPPLAERNGHFETTGRGSPAPCRTGGIAEDTEI